MDLGKLARPGAAQLGDPVQVRRKEKERAAYLRSIQDQFQRTEELLKNEVRVRDQMDQIRDEEFHSGLRPVDPGEIQDEVAAMQGEDLGRFETEQYTEIGKLEAEMNQIQEAERTLRLHVQAQQSLAQGSILGSEQDDEKAKSQGHVKSRQQRLEELVSEKARRAEVLKRQKAHLMHEKEAMETALTKLRNGEPVDNTKSTAMEVLEYTRAYLPGDIGAEKYNLDRRTPPTPSAYREKEAEMLTSKRSVDELVEKYHADRRNLQRLRKEQEQVTEELQDLQKNAWKPSLHLIAGKAEDKERSVERMEERKKELDFARGRMEIQAGREGGGGAAGAKKSPRKEKEKKKSPRKEQKEATVDAQKPAAGAQGPPSRSSPAPGTVQDEIQQLKADYVGKGGRDPSLLEAIEALERESQFNARLSHGQNPASVAAARAIHGNLPQLPPGFSQAGGFAGAPPQFQPPSGNPFAAPSAQSLYDPSYMFMMQQQQQQQQQQHAMQMQIQMQMQQQQQQQLAEARGIEAQIAREREEQERLRLELQRKKAAPDPYIASVSAKMERMEQMLQERMTGKADVDSSGNAKAKMPSDRGVARGGALPLEEEEEELRQLALFPKDSEIYRLRKKHLEEMVMLKYQIQTLQQQSTKENLEREVEELKKEHERREWMQLQQQQLLEAKYRKHMAKEKPLGAIDGAASYSGAYTPDVGLILYFDYVLGLPSKVVHQLQIVYGFFEGANASTPAKSLPMVDVEQDGSMGHRAVMATKRQFQKVPAIDRYKLIVEVQSVFPATTARGPRTTPVAWTMLRLFGSDAKLATGIWRVPMFLPPVRTDMRLEEAMNLHQVKDMELFLRLVPAQQHDVHDKFAVNPDLTQMQYRYPEGLRPPHVPATHPLVHMQHEEGRERKQSMVQRPGFDPLPERMPSAAGAPPGPASVRKAESQRGPTANVHLQLDAVVGALQGHQHCQDGGQVYLRVSLADISANLQLPTTFSAHKDVDVASTGLRVKTHVHDSGDAEYEFRDASDSWCTGSVLDVGANKTEFKEGCHLDNIPCRESSVIIVEAYQEKRTGGEDGKGHDVNELRQEPEADDVLIAWTTIQLFQKHEPQNAVTGMRVGPWSKAGLVLRVGHHKLHLLAPPVDQGDLYENIRDEQKRLGERLGVPLMSHVAGAGAVLNNPLPILELAVQEAEQPLSAIQRFKNRVHQVKMMHRMGKMLDDKVDEIFDYRDLNAWISTPDPPMSQEPFAPDDGFDLYIDGARYLPDNVTLSAVSCYATGSDLTVYAKTHRAIDIRSQSVSCPMYMCRKEIRKDPKREWDPTLTILIEINGLEKHFSGEKPSKASIVGFAVINAFVDMETGQQPRHKDVRNFTLNAGAFQLSVHRSGLTKGEAMSTYALEDELRRLCTTVTVRFVKAPRTADGLGVQSSRDVDLGEAGLEEAGLLVRPVPYRHGSYASDTRSAPLEIERFLYPSRLLHDKKNRLSGAGAWVEATGNKLMPEQEEALKDHTTFEHERFGPVLKAMQKDIRKLFQTDPQNPPAMIDHRFVIPHVPVKGFMVAIDGVDNMPSQFGFSWVAALVSKGIFYNSDYTITNDISLIHQLDYECDASRPRWTDGWNWYQNQEPNVNGHLNLIIDVRVVVTEFRPDGNLKKAKKLPKAQMTQMGFAFLPVWGVAGNYTLSGNYRLPVFAMGPPPSKDDELNEYGMPIDEQWGPTGKLLDQIQLGRRGLLTVLAQQMEEQKIHLVEGASVLVRLVDGLRLGEFNIPFSAAGGPRRVDDVYLHPSHIAEYEPAPMGKPLRDVLKKDFKDVDKNGHEMLKRFMDEYDIPDTARVKALPPDWDPSVKIGLPPHLSPAPNPILERQAAFARQASLRQQQSFKRQASFKPNAS